MDLAAEWFGGRIGVRRLINLVEGLPAKSALHRATVGEGAEWGVTEQLLASLIEVVEAVSWRSVMPHVKKGWKPPKPITVPRPGLEHQPKRQRRRATSADLCQMFGGHAAYVPPAEEVTPDD